MSSDEDSEHGAVIEVASTTLVAQLDRKTAALRRLRSVPGGWEIVGPDSSGLGFAIRLPLDARRNNVALSEDQDSPTWDVDRATGPPPAEPVSPSGIPLRKLPGWDAKRGGIMHRDSGKRALELVKAEAARQRGQAS